MILSLGLLVDQKDHFYLCWLILFSSDIQYIITWYDKIVGIQCKFQLLYICIIPYLRLIFASGHVAGHHD